MILQSVIKTFALSLSGLRSWIFTTLHQQIEFLFFFLVNETPHELLLSFSYASVQKVTFFTPQNPTGKNTADIGIYSDYDRIKKFTE